MSDIDNSDFDESLFVNNSESESESENIVKKTSKISILNSDSDNDSISELNSTSDNESKDSNDEDSDNENSDSQESDNENSIDEKSDNEEFDSTESDNKDSDNEQLNKKISSKKKSANEQSSKKVSSKNEVKKDDSNLFNNFDSKDSDLIIKYIKDNLKLDTNNLNRCISNLTNINETTTPYWGSNKYSTMRAMYEYLNLFIGLNDKINNINDIYKLNKLQIKKMYCRKLIEKITKEYNGITFDSFDEIFQTMKDDNKNFWEIIDVIFNLIYPNAEFENIPDTMDSNKESQKNNLYGIKLFQLVTNEYITDTTMFNEFVN